jgi:hypothetical protein
VAAPVAAQASFPSELVVDNLAALENCSSCDLGGASVRDLQQAYYVAVAQDLMVLASPHLVAPAESMGVYGFDISVEQTFLIQRSDYPFRANGLLATGWEAMSASGVPLSVQQASSLRLRKGLPFSIELEGTLGYLVGSRQTVASGHGRWSFQEGWPYVPDMAIGAGYGAYLGNSQLDAGALQLDAVVGWTFPVGINGQYAAGRLSPWVGYAVALGHAMARRNELDLPNPKLSGFPGKTEDGTNAQDFQFHKLVAGMRMVSGMFQFSVSAEFVVDARSRPENSGASTITLRAGTLF